MMNDNYCGKFINSDIMQALTYFFTTLVFN
jgi:hypothetical protein